MSEPDPSILVVPQELHRERVDKIVSIATGLSRGRVKELIASGAVAVDDDPVRPSDRLDAGTTVAVTVSEASQEMVANAVDFGVALETDEVVVVDKPPGLVVHPGPGHRDDTLLNGLLYRYPHQRDLGANRRHGLLHRLDRDTSGLLVVGRDPDTYDHLRIELAERRIVRRYLALVFGAPAAATGTIEAPIGRDPSAPTRNTVRVGGRPARTHYRRLAEWDEVSLLSVTLETGRTHQIRVHLRSIGLPVVGDRTYGRVDPRLDPGRTFLHATQLRFALSDGTEHDVHSPLPDDLTTVVRSLGGPTTGALPD